ncbi:MAG TPA: hypothetical protein VH740_01125 [Vicinamibacterales bacterium]
MSPGVLQMLDQVRSEFGVEVEIVDANLAGFGTSDAQRAARVLVGPELRSIGMGVLREGRPTIVSVDGRDYRLVPLRNSGSVSPTALMAMRVPPATDVTGERTNGGSVLHRTADREDPWVEVLRGAIEADLSNREQIDGERQQARAVRGALKFVTYLASAETPREIAEAAIQAAAVWFDADARVYRRRPSESGTEYTLVAALPGAIVLPEARELPDLRFGFDAPFARVAPAAGLAGGREGVVVPMTTTASAEWALVLLGTVPADADVTLEALGRVLGLQVERFALERVAQARTRFEQVLVRAERPVELTALDLLRDLVAQTSGAGAALWVQDGRDVRRLAAIGTGVEAAGSSFDEQRSAATEQVRTFTLGPSRRARLELRAAGIESRFDSDALATIDACVAVLRSWLPAAMSHAASGLSPAVVADFARRIEEELARAKRFDRDLALVVVESGVLPWPEETTGRLVDVLRGELRGSDVLGLVGERRVVVLLIETNKSSVPTVVRRLRDRLGRAIPELKVPALVLGQAAFSTDCATADALLSRAVVNAETITLSA